MCVDSRTWCVGFSLATFPRMSATSMCTQERGRNDAPAWTLRAMYLRDYT